MKLWNGRFMGSENVILGRSFDFAVKVIHIYQYLCDVKKEFVLSKQLLKSGTSIGANINEAQAAQSKSDFISKMSIASKEARETKYWIDLLVKTEYLNPDDEQIKTMIEDIDDIIKIITKIVKSSKENKRNVKC